MDNDLSYSYLYIRNIGTQYLLNVKLSYGKREFFFFFLLSFIHNSCQQLLAIFILNNQKSSNLLLVTKLIKTKVHRYNKFKLFLFYTNKKQ